MNRDRLLADVEDLADLAVGSAFINEGEYLALARCQVVSVAANWPGSRTRLARDRRLLRRDPGVIAIRSALTALRLELVGVAYTALIQMIEASPDSGQDALNLLSTLDPTSLSRERAEWPRRHRR